MTSAQKLARFGATFALALTLVATTAPSFVFAADGESNDDSAAPLVLNVVDGSIQTAAGATEFGLGTAAAASGEEGLGIATEGTGVGAAVTGAGLSIPSSIVGR